MLKQFLITVVVLSWCVITFAEDPPEPTPPPPKPAPAVLIAPKESSGTGTKTDPYLYTRSTRCLFELKGIIPEGTEWKWDVSDAPSDTVVLDSKTNDAGEIVGGRYATFSLYQDGLHQLTVYGGPIYSKVWFSIHSGTDPPPVDPIDPPGPKPDIVVGKLWVVIVKDSAKVSELPSSQTQALLSVKLREYCDTHCLTGTDGKTPEFKVYDKDTDVSKQSPQIQKAFKTAVEEMTKAGAITWLAVSNGKAGFSGQLPMTEATVIEKLQVYGGK